MTGNVCFFVSKRVTVGCVFWYTSYLSEFSGIRTLVPKNVKLGRTPSRTDWGSSRDCIQPQRELMAMGLMESQPISLTVGHPQMLLT